MALNSAQFIRSVRRRWLIQRAIDTVLVMMGVCAVSALAAMPWRAISLPLFVLGLGSAAAVGVVVALCRRPDVALTARQIDVSLNGQDLLATATATPVQDAAFAQIIQAQADAFCRNHRPSEICFEHRSAGVRVGLGLAIAIVMNVTWLMESSAFHSSERQMSAGSPIELAQSTTNADSRREVNGIGRRREDHPTLKDAGASERGFTQTAPAGVFKNPARRHGDSSGAAAAVTPDGIARALPGLAGREGAAHRSGDDLSRALAPDHGITAWPLPAALVVSTAKDGSGRAEAPAAYRDLIRAYFSESSR